MQPPPGGDAVELQREPGEIPRRRRARAHPRSLYPHGFLPKTNLVPADFPVAAGGDVETAVAITNELRRQVWVGFATREAGNPDLGGSHRGVSGRYAFKHQNSEVYKVQFDVQGATK